MSLRIPTELPAWQTLQRLAADIQGPTLRELGQQQGRFASFSFQAGPLLLDLAKQRLTPQVLDALLALAEQADLPGGIQRLLRGDIVNPTEGRAALHTALRARSEDRPSAVSTEIETAQAQMQALAADLHAGRWRGHTGKAITDVVHIGIGGSNLGPEFVLEALQYQNTGRFRIHFLASVDGHLTERLLASLDPERTLFILVSKSFSTMETRVNAETARSWLLERSGDRAALARHFLAVTARPKAAQEFGIAAENVLPMWDWVGGRYSLWSAVGLPLLLAVGPDNFSRLLAGARAMDQHLAEAPLAQNLPVLLALIGIWNSNFLGAHSHAVLCYDHRLRRLTDYLQQLETESNGKTVRLDGTVSEIPTTPVLWGGEEPNGQHSFHQMLHQGTVHLSLDFVLCRAADHQLPKHHHWLQASALSQSEALLRGRSLRELDDPEDPYAIHRLVPGNRPSTTIVLDRLTPESLGWLIALYEHKVYCQSLIWQINPFDQWGVELGKVLATQIHAELSGGGEARHDASTAGLIRHLRDQHSKAKHAGGTDERDPNLSGT